MNTLNETIKNPSSLDSLDNYMGESDFPNIDVVFCQSRDSGPLERSNFTSALKILGGENDNVKIYRFGHWACGWWEALGVKTNNKEHNSAVKIKEAYEEYPVVDGDHFYELKSSESQDYWVSLSLSEKIELCQKHSISIFSARKDYIPENDGGLDEEMEFDY